MWGCVRRGIPYALGPPWARVAQRFPAPWPSCRCSSRRRYCRRSRIAAALALQRLCRAVAVRNTCTSRWRPTRLHAWPVMQRSCSHRCPRRRRVRGQPASAPARWGPRMAAAAAASRSCHPAGARYCSSGLPRGAQCRASPSMLSVAEACPAHGPASAGCRAAQQPHQLQPGFSRVSGPCRVGLVSNSCEPHRASVVQRAPSMCACSFVPRRPLACNRLSFM